MMVTQSGAALQFPQGVEVSEGCRDLLRALITADPDLRISWRDFFNHDILKKTPLQLISVDNMMPYSINSPPPGNLSIPSQSVDILLEEDRSSKFSSVLSENTGYYNNSFKGMSDFLAPSDTQEETLEEESQDEEDTCRSLPDNSMMVEEIQEIRNLPMPANSNFNFFKKPSPSNTRQVLLKGMDYFGQLDIGFEFVQSTIDLLEDLLKTRNQIVDKLQESNRARQLLWSTGPLTLLFCKILWMNISSAITNFVERDSYWDFEDLDQFRGCQEGQIVLESLEERIEDIENQFRNLKVGVEPRNLSFEDDKMTLEITENMRITDDPCRILFLAKRAVLDLFEFQTKFGDTVEDPDVDWMLKRLMAKVWISLHFDFSGHPYSNNPYLNWELSKSGKMSKEQIMVAVGLACEFSKNR